MEFAYDGFQINMTTGVVFLDVAKTFHRLWHKVFMLKMQKMEYPLKVTPGRFIPERM